MWTCLRKLCRAYAELVGVRTILFVLVFCFPPNSGGCLFVFWLLFFFFCPLQCKFMLLVTRCVWTESKECCHLHNHWQSATTERREKVVHMPKWLVFNGDGCLHAPRLRWRRARALIDLAIDRIHPVFVWCVADLSLPLSSMSLSTGRRYYCDGREARWDVFFCITTFFSLTHLRISAKWMDEIVSYILLFLVCFAKYPPIRVPIYLTFNRHKTFVLRSELDSWNIILTFNDIGRYTEHCRR